MESSPSSDTEMDDEKYLSQNVDLSEEVDVQVEQVEEDETVESENMAPIFNRSGDVT